MNKISKMVENKRMSEAIKLLEAYAKSDKCTGEESVYIENLLNKWFLRTGRRL